MKGSDADCASGTKVFDDATGLVQATALAAASVPIAAYIEGHTAVLGEDGASCLPGAAEVTPDGDGVAVRIPWFCGAIADPLRYRSTVLIDASPDARQVVLIGAGPDAAQDLLDASRNETTLTAAPPRSLLQVIGRYTEAGIAHIFLGYDHIAFLAAVVLWARRLWPVVKVVTAFTIAHSITLSLAALDIVRIPSGIIEPAIAASIVYVAAENFLSRDIDKRWRDTFGFGLIHGFGFASALQEFGLPRSALIPALASFNLGVEIGQIVIVLLVVPALLGMDRLLANSNGRAALPTRSALAVYAISAVIIGLGSYWFLARTGLSAWAQSVGG
ncbi:MAG: HupE/UreJ family protein [Alphaproteobacteria bacterium]|nr:HupE/UreJ family protein [Alphaproteobacteria bacterium]